MVRRLRIFRRAPVFRRVMRRSFIPRLKFEMGQVELSGDA